MSAQVDALAAQIAATSDAITKAIAALAAAGTDPATIADLTAKLKVATDALVAATPA